MNWTFAEALGCLKAHGKVRRSIWPAGCFLKLEMREGKSGDRELLVKYGATSNYPFQGTSGDLLATDWMAAP
jgi:hypothetical protein